MRGAATQTCQSLLLKRAELSIKDRVSPLDHVIYEHGCMLPSIGSKWNYIRHPVRMMLKMMMMIRNLKSGDKLSVTVVSDADASMVCFQGIRFEALPLRFL